jgi:hypothetical protein
VISRSLILCSLILPLAGGCMTAGDPDPTTDELIAPDGIDEGKADAAAELYVRAGNTSLWVQPTLTRTADAWVLHARTSRNVTDGVGFVFDDPYGDFATTGARTFTVGYSLTAGGPILDGVNLFVGIGAQNAPRLTARVVARPRFVDFGGSSKIYFTAEITPVVVAGRTVFRGKGTTAAATAVTTSAGVARLVDATHFDLDLSRDDITALAGAGKNVDVTTTLANGQQIVRHAHVALTVKKLGLTTDDAYEVWPAPTCTPALKACLTALPAGALDLGPCGDAYTTNACWGQVGAVVDGESISASLAAADARIAAPTGFAADAVGLVGADHADALRAALHQGVIDNLNDQSNRWYLSLATRTAQMNAAVERAFDRAYARPLELVPAHAPIAGDAARTRQVVADALLAYLVTTDYLHSEFGRSYDQLTKEFRAQHVASIRAFRESEDIFVDPAHPNAPIYLGDWLGTHTEVTVDKTTGAATHVLVELD